MENEEKSTQPEKAMFVKVFVFCSQNENINKQLKTVLCLIRILF
jgi:hypothetical protein